MDGNGYHNHIPPFQDPSFQTVAPNQLCSAAPSSSCPPPAQQDCGQIQAQEWQPAYGYGGPTTYQYPQKMPPQQPTGPQYAQHADFIQQSYPLHATQNALAYPSAAANPALQATQNALTYQADAANPPPHATQNALIYQPNAVNPALYATQSTLTYHPNAINPALHATQTTLTYRSDAINPALQATQTTLTYQPDAANPPPQDLSQHSYHPNQETKMPLVPSDSLFEAQPQQHPNPPYLQASGMQQLPNEDLDHGDLTEIDNYLSKQFYPNSPAINIIEPSPSPSYEVSKGLPGPESGSEHHLTIQQPTYFSPLRNPTPQPEAPPQSNIETTLSPLPLPAHELFPLFAMAVAAHSVLQLPNFHLQDIPYVRQLRQQRKKDEEEEEEEENSINRRRHHHQNNNNNNDTINSAIKIVMHDEVEEERKRVKGKIKYKLTIYNCKLCGKMCGNMQGYVDHIPLCEMRTRVSVIS